MKKPFSIWVMLIMFFIMSLDHFTGIMKSLISVTKLLTEFGLTSEIYYSITYMIIKVAIFLILSSGLLAVLSPKKNAKKVLLFAWIVFMLVFLFRQHGAFNETSDIYLKYENKAEQGGAIIGFTIQLTLFLIVLLNLIFSKKIANYLREKYNNSNKDKTTLDNEEIPLKK
ncbi:hypothetical protein ID856_03530 [Xenorhabdus sp. 18]|uniref:hypothetical protein n=1 Tax=Xenorhabdus doucetiae TaxID=351671 RepID=UPI00198CB63B|nr:hypothetical protein [Xenorhabdus sp. 18]MBD2795606.1 hypothetical protein [Xenorhabdus sp. 18]